MKRSTGPKQSLEGRLIVFTSMYSLLSPSSEALENCTRPTRKPAHVRESKWQRNISRSEMKCARVDRFFPAFAVKHAEYFLVFIFTLWGCHLMQSSAGAFLHNACDLKRFSTSCVFGLSRYWCGGELVHSCRVLNKWEVMSNRGGLMEAIFRPRAQRHSRDNEPRRRWRLEQSELSSIALREHCGFHIKPRSRSCHYWRDYRFF